MIFDAPSRVRRWTVLIISAAVVVILAAWGFPRVGGAPLEDRTAELQAQLDSLKPGGQLSLEPEVYAHSGVLRLRVPDVRINGNGATLQATNDATSSVQIIADGVSLSNLTLTAPTGGNRYASADQQKLVLSGDRDTISNVSIAGSAAAGVFVTGASNFNIENVNVTGTRADGIHMTGGSRNGVVRDVKTGDTGDDAVAVVSYASDGAPSRDIQIDGVEVASTRLGRGISVVGGQNVAIRNFSVARTSGAGIYVASEGDPFNTGSTDAVSVANGSVSGANTDAGSMQGALLVYSGNGAQHVRGVQVSDVDVTNTPASAGRSVGVIVDNGSVGDIALRNIRITDSSAAPFFANAPSGSYSTSDWTVDGNPTTPR